MNEIERKMAEMSARFAAQAGKHRTALAGMIEHCDLDGLRDQAHRLAGMAGMFGQDAIGAAAFDLETALEEERDPLEAALRLDALLAELEANAQT